MVRIVQEKPKAPTELDNQGKAIFKLLGIVVADQPNKLKTLLYKYGVNVDPKPSSSQLTEAVIYAISKNDKQFNTDLAKIFAKQIIPDENDTFNTGDLAGAAKDTNVTVGSDPVSAIAGAIGSIFSFAGSLSNQKNLKNQARQQSMQSMMLFQSQKDQAASKIQSDSNKAKVIKIVGILAVVALLGGLFIWKMNKGKAVAIPETT